MGTTTTATLGLKEETLDKLRELRRLNVDSAKGFEEFAELLDGGELATTFQEVAHERREQAQELGNQIEWNDEADPEEGSYLAAMHRSWAKVRTACSSNDTAAVLSEAERGEDQIKQAYDEAVNECIGSPIHNLISSQAQAVKQVHDRMKNLRDGLA